MCSNASGTTEALADSLRRSIKVSAKDSFESHCRHYEVAHQGAADEHVPALVAELVQAPGLPEGVRDSDCEGEQGPEHAAVRPAPRTRNGSVAITFRIFPVYGMYY